MARPKKTDVVTKKKPVKKVMEKKPTLPKEEVPVTPKTINDWTLIQLKKLPIAALGRTQYDSILVRSAAPHASGYSSMLIIGCVYNETGHLTPIEIITQDDVDDIQWVVPATRFVDPEQIDRVYIGDLRTDCLLKSGMINFWSSGIRFIVSSKYASTIVIQLKK